MPDAADSVWKPNLTALAATQPQAAALLSDAASRDLRPATARDGSPTFAWNAPTDIEWLGRTTMPEVRAAALTDMFDPGIGNVLLAGLGGGVEVHKLLARLHASQAVFVLEEHTHAAAAALRLHDFARDLADRRLLLFAGPAAWEQFEAFLLAHAGYLVPQRVLNWPWFTPADSAAVRNRLEAVAARVETARVRQVDLRRSRMPVDFGDDAALRQAPIIIAAMPGMDRATRLAHSLATAARNSDVPHVIAVPDHPSRRDDRAIAASIAAASPRLLLYVGEPTSAPLFAPWLQARRLIWCVDAPPSWSELASERFSHWRFAVPFAAWRSAAVAAGVAPGAVRHLPLGADPHGEMPAALARLDVAPAVVGIQMASHAALWEATAACIEDHAAAWRDELAPIALATAERRTGIVIRSQEVREWLLARVRDVLGPALEQNLYAGVIAQASTSPDGGGSPSEPVCVLPREGLVDERLLNAAAAGRVIFVRRHPRDAQTDGWATYLDPDRHVWTFDSPAELIGLFERFQREPAPFLERAASARQHVQTRHRWDDGLREALAWGVSAERVPAGGVESRRA